jgi:hypothetical protein
VDVSDDTYIVDWCSCQCVAVDIVLDDVDGDKEEMTTEALLEVYAACGM